MTRHNTKKLRRIKKTKDIKDMMRSTDDSFNELSLSLYNIDIEEKPDESAEGILKYFKRQMEIVKYFRNNYQDSIDELYSNNDLLSKWPVNFIPKEKLPKLDIWNPIGYEYDGNFEGAINNRSEYEYMYDPIVYFGSFDRIFVLSNVLNNYEEKFDLFKNSISTASKYFKFGKNARDLYSNHLNISKFRELLISPNGYFETGIYQLAVSLSYIMLLSSKARGNDEEESSSYDNMIKSFGNNDLIKTIPEEYDFELIYDTVNKHLIDNYQYVTRAITRRLDPKYNESLPFDSTTFAFGKSHRLSNEKDQLSFINKNKIK